MLRTCCCIFLLHTFSSRWDCDLKPCALFVIYIMYIYISHIYIYHTHTYIPYIYIYILYIHIKTHKYMYIPTRSTHVSYPFWMIRWRCSSQKSSLPSAIRRMAKVVTPTSQGSSVPWSMEDDGFDDNLESHLSIIVIQMGLQIMVITGYPDGVPSIMVFFENPKWSISIHWPFEMSSFRRASILISNGALRWASWREGFLRWSSKSSSGLWANARVSEASAAES